MSAVRGAATLALALALALAFALAFALVACGPPAAPRTVSMRMTGAPPNASVTIDDQFVGTLDVVSTRGVALPVGAHHVTVEAAGYLPWDKTIEAKDGEAALKLDVRLVPVPD